MGRRKPGFTHVEYLKKSEIPTQFSDALDPAVHPELSQQIPPETMTIPAEESQPANMGEMLANYIRMMSSGGELVQISALRQSDTNISSVIAEMEASKDCEDIRSLTGEQDIYYYSLQVMSEYFASTTMLAQEKNYPRVIAEIVRFNCKTYPAATPEAYFSQTPYCMTEAQIADTLKEMQLTDEYRDICRVNSSSGIPYLYSSLFFSEKYGKAMANYAEEDDRGR